MGYFSVFIVIVSVLQTSLCTVNIEAPRTGRQNRFPEFQSEENALDFNTREGEASPNFDIESFKNQMNSLSPQQIQQIVGLLSPRRNVGSQANNNEDETKEENNGNVLTNNHNNYRRPNRRRGRRNGRRRDMRRRGRDNCNKNRGGYGAGTGYGVGRGDGNGQGYGAGMGYGSGSGVGAGNGEGMGAGSGFGMGQGYGAGSGMGTGMSGAGSGAGNGFGANPGYGSRGGRGSGYGVGRGSGGAGGNMLGFGAGGGYGNERDPYDYDDTPTTPSVSGTQGAMIGGGSEISGVKINSFARPVRNGNPSRMQF